MIKKEILLLALSLMGFATLFAQEKEKREQTFPLHISVMKESISLPVASPLKYRYNPAIIVGTEYLLKEKENHDFHLVGNLGYYYHKDWESTIFLNIGVGYRYNLKRWSIYPRLGIGYAHIFSSKPIYKFKGGQFRQVKDFGSPAGQGSFSLNTGYKLNKNDNSPVLYLTYMFTAQIPNSDFGGFHQFIGLGYQFFSFKKKQK